MLLSKIDLDIGLGGVDTNYLDCVCDNIAVLLQNKGIEDANDIFASSWYFDFSIEQNYDVPSLDFMSLSDRLLRYTGYNFTRNIFYSKSYRETIYELLKLERPLIVFGDTYYMPWLAYYEKEHHEHTCIISGIDLQKDTVTIIDAFQNRTPWGDISPQIVEVPIEALVRAIEYLRTPEYRSYYYLLKENDPDPISYIHILNTNQKLILQKVMKENTIHQFSNYYREKFLDHEEAQKFVLSCWLSARARANHYKWLSKLDNNLISDDLIKKFNKNIVLPWRQVSEYSFILSQKIDTLEQVPETCFRILEERIAPAEIDFAQNLASILNVKGG
ncbi:hypothetical protein J2T13_004985 [Paenibacillus sp. DS2015]|uniref:BtrH N-terminal domain-containing protein n=1 Tax=Paenibacillus sp. DS2015 TaxID=3373917 RepID=UPI003D204979